MATAPEATAETETSHQDYKQRVGIHRAASSSWGDASCARLCGIVMERNNGIEQSVQDLMRKEIFSASHPEKRAATLFLKNFHKSKCRRVFLKKRISCIQLQRIIRGNITRVRVTTLAIENAEDVLYPEGEKKSEGRKRES